MWEITCLTFVSQRHWQTNALWVRFGSDLIDFHPCSSEAPRGKWFAGVTDALNDLGWDQQPGHNVLVTITIMLFLSDHE